MAEKEVRPALDLTQLVPDDLMAIGLTGVQIAAVVSGIGTIVAAALAVDQFLQGGAPSFEETVQARLTAIEQKLDEYYVDLVGLARASAFSNSRQNVDILMAPLIGAALAVQQWAALNKNAPNAETLRFEAVGMGVNEVASRNALIALAGNSFFEQPMIAKPLGDPAAIQAAQEQGIDASHAYWPNSTPAVSEFGLAFDYRLGVPALLAGIPLRLKVMTGNAPDFARTGIYDAELAIYANRLRWAAQKIESGVLTRQRGGMVQGRGYMPVGTNADGQTVFGANEYVATLDGEAACIHTGALAVHRVKGTFSGQTVFAGGYAPVLYGAIDDYEFDTPLYARNLLFEMSLKEKHFHNSASATLEAMARAKLLHHLGLFEIQAMIDVLETLMDRKRSLVRPKLTVDSVFWPNGIDGVIENEINGGCLELVNGYDEPGARVAIAPMDHSPLRTRQKWTYDRVSGQVRSDAGTCLALNWNHYDDYGPIYWSPSRYDPAIARGVRVTTAYGIAEPGKVFSGPPNYARDAQRWTYNPRTRLLRNALGGGTVVLDVMWANPAAGTLVWVWDVNGSRAQRWKPHDAEGFLGVVGEIIVLTRKGSYRGSIKDGPRIQFERIGDDAHHLLKGLAEAVQGPKWERAHVVDLRDTVEELTFPLRLPLPGPSVREANYILVFDDGGIEVKAGKDNRPKLDE